jgi:hypothetical protein
MELSIITAIGEENYKNILNYYTEYANMSERDKGLLSERDKALYEKIEPFMLKMQQLDTARELAGKNDSNILENPWDYIGDTWLNWADKWAKTDNFFDIITNVVTTVSDVAETVVAGIVGVFKWLSGNWLGNVSPETGEQL